MDGLEDRRERQVTAVSLCADNVKVALGVYFKGNQYAKELRKLMCSGGTPLPSLYQRARDQTVEPTEGPGELHAQLWTGLPNMGWKHLG